MEFNSDVKYQPLLDHQESIDNVNIGNFAPMIPSPDVKRASFHTSQIDSAVVASSSEYVPPQVPQQVPSTSVFALDNFDLPSKDTSYDSATTLLNYTPLSSFRENDIELGKQGKSFTEHAYSTGIYLNLDNFFRKVYRYYVHKGYNRYLFTQVVDILIIAFICIFTNGVLNCVNYHNLFHYSIRDYIEDRVEDSQTDILQWDEFFSSNWVFVLCYISFIVFMVWKLGHLVYDVRQYRGIKVFYNKHLSISDFELGTIHWSVIVDKIIAYQNVARFCKTKDQLTDCDIANFIMRKDNYFIGFFNDELFGLTRYKNALLTTVLERNIIYCINSHIFDEQMMIRKNILSQHGSYEAVESLRKKFIIMGILNLIFAPVIFIIMIIYFACKYGQAFYKKPSSVGSRKWTLYAQWKFREFNELPHVFEERMNISEKYGNAYVNQYPSILFDIILKLVTFVTSAFFIVLLVATLLNDDLLLSVDNNTGKSLLWYMTLCGTILTMTLPYAKNVVIKHPEIPLKGLVRYIRYFPSDWVRDVNMKYVYGTITKLFRYQIVVLFSEILGIITNWYILCFYLPQDSERIIDFVKTYTTNVRGIGNICQYAMFDMSDSLNFSVCANDKLQKSYMSFANHHPNWKSGAATTMPVDTNSRMFEKFYEQEILNEVSG